VTASAAAASAAAARRHSRGRPRPAVSTACRLVGRCLARALFDVRVTGTGNVPRSGPVLLAGGHSALLDGPLVFLLSPRRSAVLAKAEIFVGPWPRLWGWLEVLPVHRGTADRTALKAGLAVLQQGGVLTVFPEGTRGSGQLEQVADGLAYLALRSGAPVVPLSLSGTAQALPRGSLRPHLRTRVRLSFGPPLRLPVVGDPRARSTVRAAAEHLRVALVDHLSTTPEEHA
jgi:1-acyl-sn-glycerol-3-phosphate acyltransferase